MDSREDKQVWGITMKSSAISLHYTEGTSVCVLHNSGFLSFVSLFLFPNQFHASGFFCFTFHKLRSGLSRWSIFRSESGCPDLGTDEYLWLAWGQKHLQFTPAPVHPGAYGDIFSGKVWSHRALAQSYRPISWLGPRSVFWLAYYLWSLIYLTLRCHCHFSFYLQIRMPLWR